MAKNFNDLKGKKGTKFIPPVPDRASIHSDLVKVSFKYLIADNTSFQYYGRSPEYFESFIDRLKHICGMKCGELQYPTVKALRNHFIKWEDTSQESFGLPAEEQLVDRPFQFGISANEHGRVIGFFIDTTFYIVWFDPDHHVYS